MHLVFHCLPTAEPVYFHWCLRSCIKTIVYEKFTPDGGNHIRRTVAYYIPAGFGVAATTADVMVALDPFIHDNSCYLCYGVPNIDPPFPTIPTTRPQQQHPQLAVRDTPTLSLVKLQE